MATNIVFVNAGPDVDVKGALAKLKTVYPELAENANYATDFRELRSVMTKQWSKPFIEVTDNDFEIANRIGESLNAFTGLEIHFYNPTIIPAKPKS